MESWGKKEGKENKEREDESGKQKKENSLPQQGKGELGMITAVMDKVT